MLLIVIVFTALPVRAVANNGYTITGTIRSFVATEVYLTYGTVGKSGIDTATVKNGRFIFKGKVKEPTPAMLFSKDYKVRLDLFIDNGLITVTGNADSMYSYKVFSKLAAVKEFEQFNQRIMQNRQHTIALFQQAYELRNAGDSSKANELQQQADAQYKSEFTMRKEYALTYPKSYIAAKELLAYTDGANLPVAIEGYENMDPTIKASAIGKELEERISILTKVEPGKPAQAFTQADVNGNPVSLASYKGKYVLVEFWASWCGPCRAENPNLLEQYNLYKNKGFDIVGVSLDDNKEKWTTAIAKDGMPWTQVSDLKGWNNMVALLYGVRAVPASFLIDPAGKIVANDLRGETLNKKLQQLFSE